MRRGDFEAAEASLLSRGPGRMVPDLARITLLADLLGNPQRAYPSIHVTGTNGKGSVTRMIATLLSSAGVSAGTYTSPHLQTVRERLSLAGRPISEADFASVHDELVPLAEIVDQQLDDHVTFFEMLTAMAYWWFADVPVDVAVFEVGMGGTWDATNLVRGEVAVIQPVDVDHKELGATPEDAAREKAGIIKPGATVVSAVQSAGVLDAVRARVAAQGATLWLAGEDVVVRRRRVAVGGQLLDLTVRGRDLDEVFVPLFGAHQADNAAVALGATAAFLGDAFAALDDDLLRQGLHAVSVPGRLEIIHRDPTIVVDGAHNPHGARTVAATMQEAFRFRTLALVLSVLEDKDVEAIARAWVGVAHHVVVAPVPSERAAPLERMQRAAAAAFAGTGVVVETAVDLEDAVAKARGVVADGDGILVTGSLYAVGAVRDRYLPVVDDPDEVIYGPDDLDDDGPIDPEELEAAIERMLDEVDGET